VHLDDHKRQNSSTIFLSINGFTMLMWIFSIHSVLWNWLSDRNGILVLKSLAPVISNFFMEMPLGDTGLGVISGKIKIVVVGAVVAAVVVCSFFITSCFCLMGLFSADHYRLLQFPNTAYKYLWNCWLEIFTDQMMFLSPKLQCQSTFQEQCNSIMSLKPNHKDLHTVTSQQNMYLIKCIVTLSSNI